MVDRATSVNLSPVGETLLIKTHGIADRRRVVAFSYMMLGMSIILPWSMLSTASSFYADFKLKWLSPSWINSTQPLSRLTEYRTFFINYLGIVIHTPETFAPVIILLFVAKADNRPRILKLSCFIVYFHFIIMVLALVDSRSWPEINIWTTFLVFSALGITTISLMSFIWASTTDFRGLEVWVNLGVSIGGILPALASIISKAYAIRGSAFSPKEYLDAAHLYFMISQVICCATWVLFGSLRFNKYYREKRRETGRRLKVEKKKCREEISRLNPVFKKTWRLQICLLYLLAITFACFPALQLGIVHQPSFPVPVYYYDILCFLVFNVASLTGTMATFVMKCPGPNWIWIPVVLRTFFIPFLMFCNYRPNVRKTPVLFHNDAFHGVASWLLGFSSGYLNTLLMEHIAKKSIEEGLDVELAMKLAAVMIKGGVTLGVFLGLMLAKLVSI